MVESFVSRPNLKKVALPKGLVVAFNLPTHAHYDTHSLGGSSDRLGGLAVVVTEFY